MESLDYWRLCDHLSVSQAALLVAGHDPGATGDDFTDWEPRNYPNGYSAALNAVQNAVMAGSISATIRYKEGLGWLSLPSSGEPIVYDDGTIKDIQELPIDWRATRLEVDSLKRWLRSRGFAKGFFFPAGPPEADYLDPDDPSYSPKLAAAVKAWEAIRNDPALTRGRSPKQALMKWLNQHAAKLGLAGDDGAPIAKAVEDIATVANWNTTGGAPKTPVVSERFEEPDPPF